MNSDQSDTYPYSNGRVLLKIQFKSREDVLDRRLIKFLSFFAHSTAGLSSATALHYLDLSFNKVKAIIGLETMKNLKSLHLGNNYISKPVALRSLSFNRFVPTGIPQSKFADLYFAE